MKLSDLVKKPSTFTVKVGGKKVSLTLRAFALKDQVWIDETFDQKELLEALALNKAKVVCQLIWNQLDNASKKKIFKLPIQFMEFDEDTGEEVEVEPCGYERLLQLFDQNSILKALDAFAECHGLNSAIVEGLIVDSKKKVKSPKSGAKYLTS